VVSGNTAEQDAANSKSQDEKIAQTFIVGFDASTPKSVITDLVTKFHLGGIYFVGTNDLEGAGFTKEYFDSLNTAAGTPLTVASDEEGGKVQRYQYPSISGGFPSAKEMGKMSDSKLKSIATKVAKELKGDGVTVDLAPVLDLNDGSNIIAQNERSFSGNPDIAAQKAKAFADGLQAGGITPIFKHFPGFGGAGSGNTDVTSVTTPSSYDLEKNVKPYKKALDDKDTSGVMLSNIIVSGLTNGKPASISKNAVDYIRSNLNYTGPITTDDLAALSQYGSKATGLSEAISDSLGAGVTMPLFGIGTSSQPTAESKLQSAIDKVKAEVPADTIDKAYSQVMTFKGADPKAAAAATSGSPTSGCCTISSDTIPAGTLPTFIPEPYNGAFTAGAEKYNVAPALIAALFSEENALGGDTHNPNPPTVVAGWAAFVKRHPDPNSGWATSSASAQGPFQFLTSTWTGLGFDTKDINNLSKAAEAAAKYAQTNGATKDKPSSEWKNFIFSYNHADWYVNAVLKYYEFYNSQPGAEAGDPTTVTSTDTSADTGCTTNNGPVRDQVVTIAKRELSDWKSKTDYDKSGTGFAYAKDGYFKYSQNRTEDWCADFVSWVFKEAGKPLSKSDWNVSLVADVAQIGKQSGSGFTWHGADDNYTPQPGDIAVHGSSHVNLVVDVSGGQVTYIGGNQGGPPYPGGSRVTEYTNNNFYTGGVTGYVSPEE
jgi:beta-N-acetylhexosaminidase